MSDEKAVAVAAEPNSFAQNLRQMQWELLALIPLSVFAAVVFSKLWPEEFQKLQRQLEVPAPFIVAAIAVIYGIRAIVTNNPLYVLLAALAAVLTIREIRDDLAAFVWTEKGVYVLLALLAIWAILWAKRLIPCLQDTRHTSWLMVTFAAYFASQVIARRAFRSIPGEHAIHRSLEEWAETTAHAMFFITSLIGTWRRWPSQSKKAG